MSSRRVIRISQADIGLSRKVDWMCRCEGYSLSPHRFGEKEVPKNSPTYRNSITVEHHGCDIIRAECGRCKVEWTIYVYQRRLSNANSNTTR